LICSNRLPVCFEKPVKQKNNHSQLRFSSGGNHTDSRRFVTTNSCSFIKHTGSMPPGFSNPGVAASKTRWIHAQMTK